MEVTEERKQKAQQIACLPGTHLDKVVYALSILKKIGQDAKLTFNGQELYSWDTEDDIYIKIFGRTRAQQEAEEIKCMPGTHLDDAIKKLAKCNEEGRNAKLTFNGQELYSWDTEDDIYMKLFGRTKAQQEAKEREIESKLKKRKKDWEQDGIAADDGGITTD
ncbi:MAG: hypothetical protein E7351_01725 [Clostridiales bacterium]|nr:hypothetical protein [Clostridiales bacterium]